MNPRKILVTSALPYVNGDIHLGHMVEHVQTDIWVRFQRLCGHEVRFFCADDTHGTATMIRARESGIEPEALLDDMSTAHQADLAGFGIRHDHYGSTHASSNRVLVDEFWKALRDGGHVVERDVTQLFDAEAGVFLADPDSVVDASSKLGIDGEVDIQSPVTNLSGALAPLPEAVLQAAALLREACAVQLQEGQVSSLVLGGRDGLPLEPGGPLPSPLYQEGQAVSPFTGQRGNQPEEEPGFSVKFLEPNATLLAQVRDWSEPAMSQAILNLMCSK